MGHDPTSEVPIIDVAPLVADAGDQEAVAAAMGHACRENGFFNPRNLTEPAKPHRYA